MEQNQQAKSTFVCPRAQGESKPTPNNDDYEPKAKAFEAGFKMGENIEEIKASRGESSNKNAE